MRLPFLAATLASLCLALPTTAQVQVFGGLGERAATSQILFGQNLAGGISIEHGQPIWQASHEKMREQLKGKLLRLGKDWWTTMTTSFPLEVAGTRVPAGAYLLGLHCDKDGKFSLTFLESTKGMKAGALPFEMNGKMNWKPDYVAPLEMHENANDAPVEKMKMQLKISGENMTGSYTLSWGPHRLTAKIAVKPNAKGDASDAGHDKDGKGDKGDKGDLE